MITIIMMIIIMISIRIITIIITIIIITIIIMIIMTIMKIIIMAYLIDHRRQTAKHGLVVASLQFDALVRWLDEEVADEFRAVACKGGHGH